MWKNGQCVTINKKKYRVKSVQQRYFACTRCALDCRPYGTISNSYGAISNCDRICLSEERKLGDYQYLKEIPAKGKVLAKVITPKTLSK